MIVQDLQHMCELDTVSFEYSHRFVSEMIFDIQNATMNAFCLKRSGSPSHHIQIYTGRCNTWSDVSVSSASLV